jgi:glycosyltransferase involved in cell wall biosynthesis
MLQKNKDKVFFIIHEMNAGGAMRVILNLVNNLDKEDFDINLIVFNHSGPLLSEVKPHVNIHNLNSSRVLVGTPKLIKLLLKEKPKIVFTGITHVNLTIAMWIPFLKKFLSNTKFITREVNIPSIRAKYLKTSKKMDYIYKRVISQFDVVIAQSHYMRDDIIASYGIGGEKIIVVNNPLDTKSIYKRLEDKSEYKEELLPKGKINILAIGMLRKQKGFQRILDIFALLDNRYHLTIIGEGSERKMLEEKIEELNISNKVTLAGLQKNPYLYMERADLVVLCSLYEGFPNVVLEANACGKFVVANACPGVDSEIINDNINGVLVEENNSQAFAKAIEIYSEINHNKKEIIKTTERYEAKNIVKVYKNIFIK